MKKIFLLSLFVLAVGQRVAAQEKYHFTIHPKQDTILVYDAHDQVVLRFGKNLFVYRQTPIKVTKEKKEFVFSDSEGELGRVSSKRYKKIHLADGNTYTLASGNKKLSYRKEGHACASAEYSFSRGDALAVGKVEVEMNVDTDSIFIPFLFQGVLTHIRATREATQVAWITTMQSFYLY
jgi:hypothetical protein